jgi:PAS domain S-box-containing protein
MQAYISLRSDFTSGGIQDLGWVAFSCFTALAALCQFDRLEDRSFLIPRFSLREKSKSFYVSIVTQLWIGAMILVMFAASSGSSQANRVYLILGLALLFVIVVYRQIVNVKDISLLHEQLRKANETLELKVQERTKSLEENANRLRISETTLKTLLNAIPEPAFLTDQTGIILAANARLASYFGGNEEAVIGRDFIEIAPPDIKADRKQRFEKIIESRQPYFFEQYLDGLYYENWISPVLNAEGNVVAMAIIAFDVTKRVLNEQQMARLIERLNLAAKAGRFGIWDWNIKDDVLVWDDLMFTIYDIPRESFTGSYSDWLNTIVEEERQETDALMQKAVRGEAEYDTVFKIRWADGSIRFLRALGKLTRDEDGNPARFTGINFDITEQKHAEQEIMNARAELERRVEERTKQLVALNRELEAFSYSVSHDLRAPLRAIIGFSQVLQEDYSNSMDDEAKEYLNRVVTAGQKMNSLVDALLMLSQVTRATIKQTQVNLSASAEQILKDLMHSEPDRQVEANIEHGIEVVGDAKLLDILLTNLLHNAWKYTSKVDRAKISVTSSSINGNQVISVSDNGAGFDMKYAGKLFDPFQRLHSSHEFSGTGVGLATVHRIVTRHGGEIWAESELGKGATFHFTLDAGR